MVWIIMSICSFLFWIYIILYMKLKYGYANENESRQIEYYSPKVKLWIIFLFTLISLVPILGIVMCIILQSVIYGNDYCEEYRRKYRYEGTGHNYEYNYVLDLFNATDYCIYIRKNYKEKYPFKIWSNILKFFKMGV